MTLEHVEALLQGAHMAGDLRMKAWCYIALGQGDADDCAMLGLDPDDDNGDRAWEVCAEWTITACQPCDGTGRAWHPGIYDVTVPCKHCDGAGETATSRPIFHK